MNRADSVQLDAVVDGVLQVLGESVVGAYQYGSAVMGGLRRFSDLDVLVVVDGPTTHDARRRLVEKIMPVSGSRGSVIAGRPVEVTVVRHGMVNPWREYQEREFQYGEWLRGDYESGYVPEPQHDHDLAPLLATVLTASRTLVGLPAQEMIDPIPHEALVRAMRHAVPSLVADIDADTTNVLLTLARMWFTKERGTITSKDEAAAWTLRQLPPGLLPPVEHARAVYLGALDPSFDQLPTPAASAALHISTAVGS